MNPSTHAKMNLEWTCPNSHPLGDTECLTQTDYSLQITFCYKKKTSTGPKDSFHFNSHVILVMHLSYGNHTVTAKSCLSD